MYQPCTSYGDGTIPYAAAGSYPSAAPSAGYPAQPQQQWLPQQLQQHSFYPNVKPLADHTHLQQQQQQQQQVPCAPPMQQAYADAPAGDPLNQPYTQPYLQPQQQQQQQQPYPGAGQQPYQQPQQQQQHGYSYCTPGLADDMQKLGLQQGPYSNGTGAYSEQVFAQEQQPYAQPYTQQQQQQQQQPFADPQQQQPYAQPYTQQQQQPYAQPYTQQQQQQQQPYSQAMPQTVPYHHSGSGNSSQYDGCNSQQFSSSVGGHQQQQQQQLHHGGSGYLYQYPNSPHQQQQQYSGSFGQQYGSGNSQHYGSCNSHQYGSCGALLLNSATADAQPSPYSSGSFGSSHAPQQQQQQCAQLPPYPAVPQPMPVMPYNVAPEKVCQGYDVMFYIQNAKNLPSMDWWNGLADPYVIITAHVGGQQFQYKTAHKRNTVNPEFDNEFFQMGNLPTGTTFFVEVWDKDVVTDDDVIGRTSWSFSPQEMLQASTAGGGLLSEDQSWGRLVVKLPLKHPSKTSKKAGEIELEVCYRPSTHAAQPRMLGPVRFRQHLSPNAGLFTGHWWTDADMSYMTYKLFLTNIGNVFDGVKMPWNRKYDKAVSIFKNPVVLSGIRTQHSALYSTHRGNNRGGVLSTAADFFEIFNYGMRGSERRFFTYVLCEDSLRCSETGAAFFNDMFSKHAMHSGGAEEVLYAGEFCIFPCPGAAGGHKLIIDNNSGTYAPDKAKLPLMQQLFSANFSDITVEVLDMKDPRLLEYQKACPSRLSLVQ